MIPGAAHSIQYDAEEAWVGSVRDWLNRFD